MSSPPVSNEELSRRRLRLHRVPRCLTLCFLGFSVGGVCSLSTPVHAELPSLAVYVAEKEEGGGVRVTGFSDGETIAVAPELVSADWHRFGLRGQSPNRSGQPDAVTEIDGDFPRIQVRSDYQIIAFSSHGEGSGDGGGDEGDDGWIAYRRSEGIAVVGPWGTHILLEQHGNRFQPVPDGAFVSPDRRFLAVMVRGLSQKELFVLDLTSGIPRVHAVELPHGVVESEPRSLTLIDGALFVVARSGGGGVLLRAPVESGLGESINAEVVSGPFAVLKPTMAYSPAAVAYLAGEDDDLLDVHVARATGIPLNLTWYPAPYLEHGGATQRLAISDDASAVGYSIEMEAYGPEPETFCHLVAVPGLDGRVHVTSDERFTPYVEQEVYIFFRWYRGLIFGAGHPQETDIYLFSELSGEVKNLTGTGGTDELGRYVPGTLALQAATLTSSGLLIVSADGFEGQPGVVGLSAESGHNVFKQLGVGSADGFFDVGEDAYFVAETDSGHGLYRVHKRKLKEVASTSISGECRLLVHSPEHAFFYVEGEGLLNLRPGKKPETLVRGEIDPAVALSPCGDRLVFSTGGEYFVLDLARNDTTPLSGAPPARGHVLAVGDTFLRGDVGVDGSVSVEDAFALLAFLYEGGSFLCPDAADADDDGVVTSHDFVVIVDYLLLSGAYVPPPFPDPGVDPTPDDLSCCN